MKGKRQKIEELKYPGAVKFGYMSKGEKRIEHVPDPKIAPLFIQCCELYANGGYSLLTLCKKAYSLGLTTKKGNIISKTRHFKHIIKY